MAKFEVKDSGERAQFDSGMVRDVEQGKIDYSLVFDGPLMERLANHLTKGAIKYERRNWMKANGSAERARFKASAVRHFVQWLRGDCDEDHFAAVIFNMNGVEYLDSLEAETNAQPGTEGQGWTEKEGSGAAGADGVADPGGVGSVAWQPSTRFNL